MQKSVKTLAIFLFGALFVMGAGCVQNNAELTKDPKEPQIMFVPTGEPSFTPHQSVAGIPDRLATDNEVIVDFYKGSSSDFYWADGYSNGGPFNCGWQKSNVSVRDGIMSMSVTKENIAYKDGSVYDYAGAEYRTNKLYSYGFYSVCMKPANCSGVISSFFTYTNKPVWDEIDIEFLGKDMSRIQFNYYTNGIGGHEYYFDLGFNASESFHEYAFDWQPDGIVWYVDGKAVYRATENLPSHPVQIMANVWNCKGADEWSGVFDTTALPATAEYKWFAYSPSLQ